MFWINVHHKRPPYDRFILVRYKDSALELNESPYEVWFGKDVEELVEKNLVAYWCEINHPIAIKNIFNTTDKLKEHLENFGFTVTKSDEENKNA